MIPRHARDSLEKLSGWYPIVVLTGPRQSGKTTLARACFSEKQYATMEDPDTRDFATSDPRGFLAQFPNGAVLDEIQETPDLLSYLQGVVDGDGRMGLFVLTGSQQFKIVGRIAQSLAGRAGLLRLLPFSLAELHLDQPQSASLEETLWRGFYPPLHDRSIPPHIFYSDYVATYVERDIRALLDVRDLSAFRRFLVACASRSGQVLNLAALGADCGITHNTASAWLSVLEASDLVLRVPPWFRNIGKRLTKAPKLLFLDSGLAAWLCGIREADQLRGSIARGGLFESLILAETLKNKFNRGGGEQVFYLRESHGNEVDFLIEDGARLTALECKSGATVAEDWFSPLLRLAKAASASPALVYGGEDSSMRHGVQVVGWRNLASVLHHGPNARTN